MAHFQGQDLTNRITHNIVNLISELQPYLFIDRMTEALSPDVCIKVRGRPTNVEQADTLLTALLNQASPTWFEAFLSAIAGLYPGIFKSLTDRSPTDTECIWYIQPLCERLRQSVLERPAAANPLLKIHTDMEHHYVSPQLLRHQYGHGRDNVLSHSQDTTDDSKQYITETDLVSIIDTGGLILVYGRAGVGKSTMVHHLTWQWANGLWTDKYPVVFSLNLRKLVLFSERIGLATLLQEYTEFPVQSELPEGGVATWLDNNSGKVLIFVDGIDELSQFQHYLDSTPRCHSVHAQATPLHWAMNLLRKDMLSDCCVVITSRPFEELSSLEIREQVEIVGLTKEGVQQYIQSNVDEADRDKVHGMIYKNPFLLSVCTITFYCAALCRIFTGNTRMRATNLVTYTRITEYIIRHLATTVRPGKSATLLPDHLRECFPCLEQLAYGALPQNQHDLTKLIFDEEDLNAAGISQEGLEKAVRSGLIIVHKKDGNLGLHVEFIHRSVQDFLAMRKLLRSHEDQLQRYLETFTFQCDMTMLFLYGLALDSDFKKRLCLDINARKVELLLTHVCIWGQWLKQGYPSYYEMLLNLAKVIHEAQSTDLANVFASCVIQEGVLTIHGQMTAVDMRAFHFIVKESQQLHTLRLQACILDEACAQEFRLILHDTKDLQKVYFMQNLMTTKMFQSFFEILSTKVSLNYLHLANSLYPGHYSLVRLHRHGLPMCPWAGYPLGGACVKSLHSTITLCGGLDELHLADQEITDCGAWHLSQAIHHLRVLRLSMMRMRIGAVHHISDGIAGSPILKSLYWYGDLPEEGIQHIVAGVSKSCSVKHFSFGACRLFIAHIWANLFDIIRKESSRKDLMVSGDDLDHQLCRCPSTVIRHSTILKKLSLTKDVTHIALGPLWTAMKHNSSLSYLELGEAGPFCLHWAPLCCTIRQSQSLTYASLHLKDMTFGSWAHLSAAIGHSPGLTSLDLCICRCPSDRSVRLLCEGVKHAACLRNLAVRATSIKEASINHLTLLKPELACLSLTIGRKRVW